MTVELKACILINVFFVLYFVQNRSKLCYSIKFFDVKCKLKMESVQCVTNGIKILKNKPSTFGRENEFGCNHTHFVQYTSIIEGSDIKRQQ